MVPLDGADYLVALNNPLGAFAGFCLPDQRTSVDTNIFVSPERLINNVKLLIITVSVVHLMFSWRSGK